MHIPGVYKFRPIPGISHSHWGWCRFSDMLVCIHEQHLLKNQGRRLADPEQLRQIAFRFADLMAGKNMNEGGGKINYLAVTEAEDTLQDDTFDAFFNIPNSPAAIEPMMQMDPYLIFIPSGWTENVMDMLGKGIEYVDRIPPPRHDLVRDEESLFAHTKHGEDQLHFHAHRSGGWEFRLYPVSETKPSKFYPLPG